MTRIRRPQVEHFIRLCNDPDSPWGMADADALELCHYILALEPQLARTETALREFVRAENLSEIERAKAHARAALTQGETE